MKLYTEDQLLDEATRKQLIKHIDSESNKRRKREAFRRYECLKDKTVNYVLDLLLKQFDVETVYEMQYAMSNLSVFRKVIQKLAKVYANGVKRTMPTESDTALIEDAAVYLDMNAAMKKTNRYFRAFLNTLVFVKPQSYEGGKDVCLEVLPPFHYDVVEKADNPRDALAIVLSDYAPTRDTLYSLNDAALAGRSGVGHAKQIDAPVQSFSSITGIGGGASAEGDKRRFIWWSKGLHFTTDVNGVITDREAGEEITNPIAMLPFVNFVGEQDGQFWAEGGQDLADAGVSINVGLTNIKHAGFSQGFGQLYMTGKDLPKSVKTGINHCVQLEVTDKDEPQPTIGYLSANPPLDSLKSILEMEVALMLTTNNLSTSGFSVSLQGGKDFASGIALMIDKSESVEDISEQAAVFVKKEPEIFALAAAWSEVYRASGELTEAAAAIAYPKNPEEVQVAFPSSKPVMSESEQLDIYQKRKDMGLNTMIEILMRDDPSLTEETAQAKLDKIAAEKSAAMDTAIQTAGATDGNQSEKDDGNGGGNVVNDKPNGGAEVNGGSQGAG